MKQLLSKIKNRSIIWILLMMIKINYLIDTDDYYWIDYWMDYFHTFFSITFNLFLVMVFIHTLHWKDHSRFRKLNSTKTYRRLGQFFVLLLIPLISIANLLIADGQLSQHFSSGYNHVLVECDYPKWKPIVIFKLIFQNKKNSHDLHAHFSCLLVNVYVCE